MANARGAAKASQLKKRRGVAAAAAERIKGAAAGGLAAQASMRGKKGRGGDAGG